MADKVRWYVLFKNYEQGLALHDLLDRNNIRNRIAPAPRAIQGDLTCGISLMLEEEDVEERQRRGNQQQGKQGPGGEIVIAVLRTRYPQIVQGGIGFAACRQELSQRHAQAHHTEYGANQQI
jgi:hypothetical protein